MESVTLNLGNGDDTFVFENSHGGGTTLNAGGGSDTVNVLALSGRVAVWTVTDGRRATNEVQEMTAGGATGGSFQVNFGGQVTSAIPYNASAAALKSALEALSNIQSVDVAGTGTIADPWRVTFLDPGLQDVAPMTVQSGSSTLVMAATVSVTTENDGRAASASVPANAEVQAIYTNATAGHFTLTFNGQTSTSLAYNATAAQVKSALEAVSGISSVEVTGTGSADDPWRVTFLNPAAQNVAELAGNAGADLVEPADADITTKYRWQSGPR